MVLYYVGILVFCLSGKLSIYHFLVPNNKPFYSYIPKLCFEIPSYFKTRSNYFFAGLYTYLVSL